MSTINLRRSCRTTSGFFHRLTERGGRGYGGYTVTYHIGYNIFEFDEIGLWLAESKLYPKRYYRAPTRLALINLITD